jgi:hypothetical protein
MIWSHARTENSRELEAVGAEGRYVDDVLRPCCSAAGTLDPTFLGDRFQGPYEGVVAFEAGAYRLTVPNQTRCEIKIHLDGWPRLASHAGKPGTHSMYPAIRFDVG